MSKEINRRDFLKVTGGGLAGVALFGAAGCGGGGGGQGDESGDSESIKIGVLLSFSGPFATLSEGIKNGIELYLEQNGNKVGGRPVEISYEDDEGEPQPALRKYRQLVTRDQIDVLVSPFSSTVALALVDQVIKDEIIMIVPNAAANALSLEKKSDNVYRVSYSNWQLGAPGAAWYTENVGKTAVTVASDYPAGLEGTAAFKAAYEEAGGSVARELYPPLGTNDFATFLTQIREAEPDMAWVFLSGSDAINFAKQYQSFRLKDRIQLTGVVTWVDPVVTEPLGETAEGITAVTTYTPNLDNEVNKQFAEAYQAKYNETSNQYAVHGYDALQLIDQAVQDAGSIEMGALVDALKSNPSIDSPRGPITIDPETHNPIQPYYVTRNVLRDGKIVSEVSENIGEWAMPADPAKVPG